MSFRSLFGLDDPEPQPEPTPEPRPVPPYAPERGPSITMTYASPPTNPQQAQPQNQGTQSPTTASNTQQIYAQNHSNQNGSYSQSAPNQQEQEPEPDQDMVNTYDREIDAMQAIIDSLNTLDSDAQSRVLTYLNDRYLGMASVPATPSEPR